MSKRKVMEVKGVQLDILKSNPPKLSITAFGTVNTSGWEDAELSPVIYIQPPPDGIYDFDFVAEPPEGPALQVIMPISAELILDVLPPDMKGVRIHATANNLEASLGGAGDMCIRGVLTAEGVECQAMRDANNVLYTLAGDLAGFQTGDEVYVIGPVQDISICNQGITIAVRWITKG